MKLINNATLAAVVLTVVLTIWSVIVSFSPVPTVPDWSIVDLFLFTLSTFGMIGLPTLLFAIAVAWAIEIWKTAIAKGDDSVGVDAAISSRIASQLLLIPATGLIVGVLHFYVTSTFVRPVFQALGLFLMVMAVSYAMFGVGPLVERLCGKFLSLIGAKPDKYFWATRKVIFFAAVIYALGTIGGSAYLISTAIWPTTLVLMLALILVLIPGALLLFSFKKEFCPVNTIWFPVAMTLVFVLTFWLGGSTMSRSEATRIWINDTPSITGLEARVLRRVTDNDRDGFSAKWGGTDCDDNDESIYPGAFDFPGDGIDQSCDGEDAPLNEDISIEPRRLIYRAIAQALTATQLVEKKTPEAPKNILVILVDTLRMDHTGFGGYDRPTTPTLDALAAKSTVFLNAYATSPHTPRSIPAIFLSRYASKTKWKGAQYNYPKVLPDNLSYMEVLQAAGWQTQGVSSHHYFEPIRGLDQGVDNWDNDGALSIAESNDDIAAPRTWGKLEPILERYGKEAKTEGAKPFSLFVHFFEPHARWIMHDDYKFDDDGSTESKHIAKYDSEIRFVDDYLAKIFKKLDETGLADSTIIAIVADHGEGFNEHGYFFHGQTLYNEVIHVPLVMHVPGWKPRRIESPVSIIDIAPTVLDLVKVPIPAEFQGESLVPYMLNGEEGLDTKRVIFAELLPYTAWKEHHRVAIQGRMKLIDMLTKGTQELYDLSTDPGEKKNLIGEKDRAQLLRDALKTFAGSQ